MSSMPVNWETAPLSDVSEIIRGLAFPSADKRYEAADGRIGCLRTANVQENVEWEDLWFIPRKHLRNERQIVRHGDILISTANSYELVGKVALVKEIPVESTLGAFISMIRPHAALNPSYIYLFLASSETQQAIRELASTTVNISNVSTGKLAELRLRIAPRPEQDRIVAEIEKQFTRLDDAVVALKRTQANLKRYRASVLKAACEGRLVPTEAELARKEGRDYEPASELLKRILAERRAKWEADQLQKMIAAGKPPKNDDWRHGHEEPVSLETSGLSSLPEGWTWAKIDQVGIVQLGRQRAPQHHTGKFMRPYLRVANVFEDRIEPEGVLEMNFTPQEFKTYELKPGDILLNEGQSLEWVGRSAIYNGEVPGACFQNTLVRFRAHNGVLPRYAQVVFLHYLHSKRFQRIARWTVNIAHLGAERFSSLEFPLPPLIEQQRIVDAIDRLQTEYQHSLAALVATSAKADQLRRAMLEEAFSGKLVFQDPNDEPASVLLERIRAERSRAQEQKQKTPKVTNGASSVNGQRRRRVEKLAQGVSPGKG